MIAVETGGTAASAAVEQPWVAPAVIAAMIAAAVALVNLSSNTRRARLDRQRHLFAEAFGATAEYCEFPYIIRRRDSGPEERIRISTAMSDVQHRLTRYQALLLVEAPSVAGRFDELVTQMRRVAGGACHDAWEHPIMPVDAPANIADIDLTALDEPRRDFLDAARSHLQPVRGRLHLMWRRWRRRTSS